MDDDDFLLELWRETRGQNNSYLEGFGDIKRKVRILLVISSIFITAFGSISFDLLKDNHNTIITTPLMLASILLLTIGLFGILISIPLLMISMMDSKVKLPMTSEQVKKLKNYTPAAITKGIIREYNIDMDHNIEKIDNKRRFVRIAERLIISSIFILVLAIALLLI